MSQFDEIIDRKGTSCLKYDFAVERGYKADILPFWVADMDFRTAPVIREELKKWADFGIFGYTNIKPDYRESVLRWQARRHGFHPSPESLVITPGVVFALATAARAFTKQGDAILIQQPVYYPFSNIIRNNDRHIINSPLVYRNGRYEIDFNDFEKKIAVNDVRLFLLCNPHNPVGRVFTREELTRLGDICRKHGVLVVSDEIHAEFVRSGHKHIPFASLSPALADITVTCTAPSKTFNLAALQISNIFIENEELRRTFKKELAATGYDEPNMLGLFAAKAAYDKGEPWLLELSAYLEQNLEIAKTFLAEELPKVKLVEPEGTYLIWLDFSAFDLSDAEINRIIIEDAGLWLDAGGIFGKDGEGFQRINIACPRATLQEGLKRLTAAFRGK
ncbi:cystathionine beta-lyase PatB [Selenomonas sp. TAMA-11512]|uniref:MalY/PatB family protein n=1 Tax=Selenomonas sp. TAMA-11512 TaxID=3095337 RepID=UPI003090162C|nr:cystathionine beta-lyase PatB [Selenomonas sp. TAMA-11512]